MTEELEQKAKEYAQKYINHKMAIHDIFDLEVVQKDVTRLLAEFAEETTKELQKQIEELTIKNNGLKSDCDAYNYSQRTYQEQIKELQTELEKWKSEWQEQVQKATDEGYARTQLQIENGKLKEQIEKMRSLKDVIIKAVREDNSDCVWEHAHNGKAKYIYAETVVDIINDKWELAE